MLSLNIDSINTTLRAYGTVLLVSFIRAIKWLKMKQTTYKMRLCWNSREWKERDFIIKMAHDLWGNIRIRYMSYNWYLLEQQMIGAVRRRGESWISKGLKRNITAVEQLQVLCSLYTANSVSISFFVKSFLNQISMHLSYFSVKNRNKI